MSLRMARRNVLAVTYVNTARSGHLSVKRGIGWCLKHCQTDNIISELRTFRNHILTLSRIM